MASRDIMTGATLARSATGSWSLGARHKRTEKGGGLHRMLAMSFKRYECWRGNVKIHPPPLSPHSGTDDPDVIFTLAGVEKYSPAVHRQVT